uniref:Uncharacterized protein n=1 Tax=Panagrolaimus sp. JU765 TaxID=591449 RepID=A0AC34QMC2_9BILA
MKAFKNRRQQTFHSLEAYNVDEKSLTTDNVSEDVLKMPAIESLKLSSPKTALKNPKKNYQKIHSDPSLVANRSNSTSNVKRILHTIDQPDGSVIGYCTEAPVTPTPDSASSSTKNDVQPSK